MNLPRPLKTFGRQALHTLARALLRVRSRSFVWDSHDSVALIVAPHPDDEALGCGGLIALRRQQGLPVHVVYVTDGSASHPDHPTLTPWKLVSRRIHEARDAMGELGVAENNLHFLCAPDSRLPHLSETITSSFLERLVEIINATNVTEVFLPSRYDGSTEHLAAHTLVQRALEESARSLRVYEYPIWSWWNPRLLFRPALESRRIHRVARGGHSAAKIRAIRRYRSQVEPIQPWPEPLLSPEFVYFFEHYSEYFFEY
jgi:LmbE family N-acetylglucosaminyl deacetylase